MAGSSEQGHSCWYVGRIRIRQFQNAAQVAAFNVGFYVRDMENKPR